MRIGLAGTGRMGAAMASRLLHLGQPLSVWNRSPQKTRPLAAAGAAVAVTPSQLAAMSDVVLSVLTDAPAIDAVYRAHDGLLAGDVGGKLFVEMSTVRPADQQALSLAVAAKGAALIDCPVGGTVGPAREGALLGLVGGDPQAVARAQPILDLLCHRVEHVGPIGAGSSLKLAINLPMHVYWQVLGEALSLCKPLALAPERLLSIVAETSGAPNALKTRSGIIAAALRGEDTGPVTFDVDTLRKDLQVMIEESKLLGGSLPLAEQALECFDQAAREGLGGENTALLVARWLRRT